MRDTFECRIYRHPVGKFGNLCKYLKKRLVILKIIYSIILSAEYLGKFAYNTGRYHSIHLRIFVNEIIWFYHFQAYSV